MGMPLKKKGEKRGWPKDWTRPDDDTAGEGHFPWEGGNPPLTALTLAAPTAPPPLTDRPPFTGPKPPLTGLRPPVAPWMQPGYTGHLRSKRR